MSGINGVYSIDRKFKGKDLIERLYSAANSEQLRGEAGAGITMIDSFGEMKTEKGLGLLTQAIDPDTIYKITNPEVFAAINQNRYSREDIPSIVNTQPIDIETDHYQAAIAADSKIVGWEEEINTWFVHEKERRTKTGAEVFGRLFLNELENANGDFKEAGEKFFYRMNGKGLYSILMLLKEKDKKHTYMIAIRDPHAGLPFHYAQKDETLFLSSGTYPMEQSRIDFKDIKEVPRGSMMIISENGVETTKYKKDKIMTCVFERIYFGCPEDRVLTPLGEKFDTLFEEYYKAMLYNPKFKKTPSNFMIRNLLGACMAERHPELTNELDILVPIVDTGKGVTYGLSKALGIPYIEALLKRLSTRSFQISDQEFRKMVVDLKTSGLAEFINGKRIGAGDDSVVKGGVGGYYSKKRGVLGLLEMLGADSIHMLISYSAMPFPSIRGFTPYHRREKMAAEGLCYMPTKKQEKIVGDKMGKGIKVPVKLRYQLPEDTRAIFGPDHCFACMDGIYPVDDKYIPDWVKAQRDMSYARANKKWV
ncbi:MAG: hypothetical protein NT129_05700 [Candidatus Aenigmarchaeota archaeon]|nr:hypothetical protein [Candidatus Aenigmarchaeota archaeon]